jgi:hypothetical protein
MYILRTEKNGVQDTLPPVSHFTRKNLDRAATLKNEAGESLTGGVTGIEIELPGGRVIHLPTDADVIYVMNAAGDTVDTIRYPPKK